MPNKSEIRNLLQKNVFQRNELWNAEQVNQVVFNLQVLFKESDLLIKERILQACRAFPFPEMETFLLEQIQEKKYVISCCEVLGDIGTQKSLSLLKTYFRSSSFLWKWSAIEASQKICERLKLPLPVERFSEQAQLLIRKGFDSSSTRSDSDLLASVSSQTENSEWTLETHLLSKKAVPTRTCLAHPMNEVEFFCTSCGMFLCKSCGVSIQEAIYCDYCAWRLGIAPVANKQGS